MPPGIEADRDNGQARTEIIWERRPTNVHQPSTCHSDSKADSVPRVLIADDDRVGRLVLSNMCRQLGYAVETAANGIDALHALLSTPYDAAVIDCYMPSMDAPQLLGTYLRVAADPTPIALISAEDAPHLTYGAHARQIKPIGPAALAALLREMIG
ncbi:MAG: response regulator [Gammaproteobacteria bacterium]|nr:response regulator [Gammaproteobacteria bacterium]